jgi:hypothetical protein
LIRQLRGLPVYPGALAAAFVITRYLQSVEPIQVLSRAVIVFVLLALAIQVVYSLVARNLTVGAFLGAATVMLLADPIAGLLLLGAGGAIPIASAARARSRRLRPADWTRLTTILNVVSMVVLALSGGQLVVRASGASGPPAVVSGGVADPGSPDLSLILLDGYPRADTLLNDFAFDNGPFLRSMEDLGFDVADHAHTNYNATMLTLASMLNVRHVRDIAGESPRPPNDVQVLIRAINNATGLATLREQGYTIVTVPSGLAGFSLYSADRILDTGQINNFEITILRAGLLPLILPGLQNTLVHDALRARITDSFDQLVELAATPADRPRFVFAHMMSPHPPIVFGADGSPRYGWGCFPQGCDPWGDLYNADVRGATREQIEHLNVLVHEAASGLIQRSTRDAVVIVFSDHGRRHNLRDRDEMIRSLFISYTPGHPGLFPDDTTPINVLPRLLGAYEGLSIPLTSEESYVLNPLLVPTTGYFDLTPWPP